MTASLPFSPEWFQAIYAEYKDRVLGQALRLLKNYGEAEDLAHEVFLYLLRKRDYDPSKCSLGTYFWIETNGLAINRYRRMHVRKQLKGDYVDVDEVEIPDTRMDPYARLSDKQEVSHAWAKLTPGQRAVMRLVAIHGYTYREVAEQLGFTEISVRNHYIRGLERLRKHFFGPLKAEWPETVKHHWHGRER